MDILLRVLALILITIGCARGLFESEKHDSLRKGLKAFLPWVIGVGLVAYIDMARSL